MWVLFGVVTNMKALIIILFPFMVFAQDLKVSSSSIYGVMGFADSSLTIAMTRFQYYPITNPTHNLFIKTISTPGLNWQGDTVQVLSDGYYEILYSLSFSGTSGDFYHISIFVNNIELPGQGESQREMTGANASVSSSITILVLKKKRLDRIKN